MSRHASKEFVADAAQLASVRDFARCEAYGFDVELDVDLLTLLVGELAANAALHQDRPARLDLELDDIGRLEISVTDPSPAPAHLIACEPWSTDGHRGLQLVAALSQDWGVEAAGEGKRVWARIGTVAAPVS